MRSGEKLLSGTTTLVRYPDPANPPYNGYLIFGALLGIPMLLGLTLYLKTSCQKAGLRIFGLAMVLWGGVAGIFGSYLSLAWAFSEHTVVHHNANLWLFWPIDWYFLFLGVKLVGKGGALRPGSGLAKFTFWFVVAHLAALGIYGLLAISGFFIQHVTRVLAYFGLPALLLCCLTLHLAGFRLGKVRGR